MNRAYVTGPPSRMRSAIHFSNVSWSDCGCISTMIYFSQIERDSRFMLEGEKLSLATLIVCPRCRGSVQPDAHACPRCGLVLTGLGAENPSAAQPYGAQANDLRPAVDATTLDYGP